MRPGEEESSIGTDGELPVGGEETIFKHCGLAYQPALAVSGGWPAAEQRTKRRTR